MKRWILRILLCLILGAITTVAAAWGCVVALPPHHDHHGLAENERVLSVAECEQLLRRTFPHASPSRHEIGGVTQSRFGWMEMSAEWDTEFDVLLYEHAIMAGWPVLALRGSYRFDDTRADGESGYITTVRAPGWVRGETGERRLIQILPTGPIWPGFAIDTLFYAAIWGGVFFGFAGAKRAIRRRRGRCPMCGYDLRGALENGCSECGWRREHDPS